MNVMAKGFVRHRSYGNGKDFHSYLYSLPISELLSKLRDLPTSKRPKNDIPLQAICTRLGYLEDVGLGYLSLDRSSRTLSGGETQRINLTACLGAGLTDTLFSLDEPTIGLHHQDVERLIKILRNLADGGNFVCVVEHDEQVIRAADRVIEIGPEPGLNGGHIIFNGTVSQLLRSKKSETGKWLSGKKINNLSSLQNSPSTKAKFLKIRRANIHNFKNFSANLPLWFFYFRCWAFRLWKIYSN